MHIYIPKYRQSVDLPADHVKMARKWASKILTESEAHLKSISPILFVTFLVVLNDVSGRILEEYFSNGGLQQIQKMAGAVARTAEKREAMKKAAERAAARAQKASDKSGAQPEGEAPIGAAD